MRNLTKKISLRLLLVLPFIVQISVVVMLTACLSIHNGRKAVNDVASQLRTAVSDRIKQQVFTYLDDPHLVNAVIAEAMSEGEIDVQDLPALERYFWRLVDRRIVNYIQFGSESGYVVAVERVEDQLVVRYRDAATEPIREVYNLDSQGNRVELIKSKEYDPRTRPWYTTTVAANAPFWSPFYVRAAKENPVVAFSPSQPIYDRSGKLLGVLQNLFEVGQIRDFLASIEIGHTGQTFIIERNGNMVASSKIEQPYLVEGKKVISIKAVDSVDPIISATAQYLADKFGVLDTITESHQLEFDFQGERQFVQVLPINDGRGVDWLSVVVIPESDFMAQIDVNMRNTLLLCMAALVIATILGLLTSRWITQPILRLSQASEAITAGKLAQKVDKSWVKEIDILAKSFNRMAQQLRESFAKLAKTNEELEIRVEERTAELTEAKEKAEIASRAKSEFLSSMSHELRTPLNSILGYAQILRRDLHKQAQYNNHLTINQDKGLKIIYQSGNHLLTLIEDILDLSKIEARKLELYLIDIHLNSFLSEVINIVKMQALEKDLLFHYEALPNMPTVIQGDEKRLRQILLNLLGNAVKFTDLGAITLRVTSLQPAYEEDELLKQTLRFEIKDTGIGMNSQQLAKIFEPFEQVGDIERRAAGTGLGLTITKQLVELMGGKLQVSSELSKGSTFWFDVTFPIVESEMDLDKIITANRSVIGYKGKRRQILIVDDKEENRLVLQNMLEPLGFEITLGENGQQEIELAQKIQPDCILTDLVMPVKTGFEAVKEIRQIPAIQDVMIIAISASVLEQNRQRSRIAGCEAFIPKPVDQERLLALLQDYLQLEWIYEDLDSSDSSSLVKTKASSTETLIAPPPEEMEILYELAMLGSMKKIRERAIYLEQLGEEYAPLAAKLQELAQGFQEKAIVNLIKQYL